MTLTRPTAHPVMHTTTPPTDLHSIAATLESLNRTHAQIASALLAIAKSLYALQSDLAQYDAHFSTFLHRMKK